MDAFGLDRLDDELERARVRGVHRCHAVGTVTGLSPLRVRVDVETADERVTAGDHVTPVVGRRVVLARVESSWFVTGQLPT